MFAQRVLSRASFGARPEDAAHLAASGAHGWLDRQLSPAVISEAALDERLADLEDLAVPSNMADMLPERGRDADADDGSR